MRTRKWIKRIAAVGAGISMVGATLLGAVATDLSTYPAPFVKDGNWDGVIVVGANAAASDVVGAIDLGASLQYDMRQVESVGISVDPTVSDGKKIAKTGDQFNYGDDIYDIFQSMDDEDLPVILATKRYTDEEGDTKNKVEYEQKLYFSDNTETLKHVKDKESDAEITSDYLVMDDSLPAYTYELEFDSAVEFVDGADLEDTTISIQGQDYTITDVSLTGDVINKIELLAGETVMWLQQGKTVIRIVDETEHEVVVSDVNDAEDMCGVSIDGDTTWIKKGSTKTLNGVSIGVSDAIAVHAQLQDVDVCKLNLGATEIELKDGSEVKVNGYDIDGSEVTIDQSTANELEWLTVSMTPEDDVFLAEGQTWTDPVFGRFGINFAGMSSETEKMEAEAEDDEALFTFTNNDGDEVEIPMIVMNNAVFFGDGDNSDMNAVISSGQRMVLANGETCVGATDATDCEGLLFLAISSGDEARVFEVSDVDINDRQLDIKDVTTGKTHDDEKFGNDIDLKLLTADIALSADNTTITFNNIQDSTVIDTGKEAIVALTTGVNITSVSVTEDDGNVISFDYVYNIEQEEVRIQNLAGYVSMDEIEDGSDIESGYTLYGTILVYDTDNKDNLELLYPEEDAYGSVFVSPTGAQVTDAGELSTVTINPIATAARLDTEVTAFDQNMIIVGGPCANEAAKFVMGADADCKAGFTPGKAIVKMVEDGENVAMLIAGYSAADTTYAVSLVVNHEEAPLAGEELIVEVPQ